MGLMRRVLAAQMEDGWILETAGTPFVHPESNITYPGQQAQTVVSVLVQQRAWSGMTETTTVGVKDERVALVMPAHEIPADAVLVSPRGEAWLAAGEGMPRQVGQHLPVYTAVPVRRAKERDR